MPGCLAETQWKNSIQAMKAFASTSSGATKEASDIVQNMLDRFSTDNQILNKHSIAGTTTTTEQKDDSSSSQSIDTPQNDDSTNKTEESCCAP